MILIREKYHNIINKIKTNKMIKINNKSINFNKQIK